MIDFLSSPFFLMIASLVQFASALLWWKRMFREKENGNGVIWYAITSEDAELLRGLIKQIRDNDSE